MKWLHLSDIHYSPEHDGTDARDMREKLPAYLKDNQIKVEHIFVTGDFRHALKQIGSDEDAAKNAVKFLMDIASEVGITDPASIHIVPGNHDHKRFTDKSSKNRLENIRDNHDPLHGRFGENDIEFMLSKNDRFGFFQALDKELHSGTPFWGDQLSLLHRYYCDKDFSLLYLNSTFSCNAKEDREGKLILGSYHIDNALREIHKKNPNKPIIVLAHHGVTCFKEAEQKKLRQIFEKYPVSLYLCGDSHDPWREETNGVLEITMGCLTYEKSSRPAFSIGELNDKQNISIEAHEWDNREPGWGPYSQFNQKMTRWPLSRPLNGLNPLTVISKTRPLTPSAFYKGRAKIEDIIKSKLEQHGKLVLLHGMGGMGKTEICRKLFNELTDKGHPTFEKIGWLTYHDSLPSTMFDQFPDVQVENQDDYFLQTKNYINQIGDKLLLIIDDANEMKEQEAAIVSALGCSVIITSRRKFDRLEPINVGQLDWADCRELYRDHSKDYVSADKTLNDIILLADRHTLSVELLAKTQLAAGNRGEEFLAVLQEKGFNLSGITEQISYIHTPEKPSIATEEAERIFIEHMSIIFDIAAFSSENLELKVLRLFSLLGADPVTVDSLRKWFELDSLNPLNDLVRRGWLIHQTGDKGVLYAMHPVIRSVVQYKAHITYAEAESLISILSDELVIRNRETVADKQLFLSPAAALGTHFNVEAVSYARLCHNLAHIYAELGRYDQAMRVSHKALAVWEKVLGKEHPSTATTYNNIAFVHYRQGDYAKGLEWYEKALAVWEKVLGKEHPDTATTYNNIAGVYSRQGDYAKALEWYEKDLAVSEKVLGKEHPSTATTYNNIAGVYSRQGDYAKALEWYEKALAIFEKRLGHDHQYTQSVRNSIEGIRG